jgi:DNA-binding transcriptional MerR regulator
VTYTADDVVKATGLTYRALDHWLRKGYLDIPDPTPGSGFPRRFTDDQLDHIGTVKALVDAGFTTRAAAAIAHNCPYGEWEIDHIQVQWNPGIIHDELRKALTNREATHVPA